MGFSMLNPGCRMVHRHYGQMGRGEAKERYHIQAWESTDNHRSTVSYFDSRTSFGLFPTSSLPLRSYASILSRPSRHKSERKGPAPSFVTTAFKSRVGFFSFLSFLIFPGSDGFGNVPTGNCVNTDTLSHQDLYSSPRRRLWRRQRRRTRSAWKSF
jgi:hypothetical protein